MRAPGLARQEPVLTRLRAGVRLLFPGYFALVMATGIVSTADGAGGLSAAMLVLAVACYLVLIGGRDGTWVAFAVWAVVFAAMLAGLAGLPRGAPVSGQR